MKLNKNLKLGLLAICSSVLFTSCGGATNNDTGKKENIIPAEITEKTSIILSTTAGDDNLACIQLMADSFMEENPLIDVKLVQESGSYSDIAKKVRDGFATGDYPDMTMVYPDAVADYIDYGKAYDLTDYINHPTHGWTAEEKADFVPSFLEEGTKYTIPGTYSLPFSKSTEVVYYDRSTLDGLAVPGINSGNPINEKYLNSLTWEEFFGVFCPKIIEWNNTQPKDKKILNTDGEWAVMAYDSDANLFITLCEQYGIPYTSVKNGMGSADFNNPEMKELMKTWHTYAQNNYILSQKSTGKRSNEFFAADKALFSVGSTGGAKYQLRDNPEEVGVFKIPHAQGKEAKVILQGPSMAFLEHQKGNEIDYNRKLASWLFYKHCVTEVNALDWALTSNYFPVLQSIYDTDEYKDNYNEANVIDKKSVEALGCRIATLAPSITPYYYTSPAFKGSNTCRDQVDALMGKVLKKESNISDLEKWFTEAYNACGKAIQ